MYQDDAKKRPHQYSSSRKGIITKVKQYSSVNVNKVNE